MAHVLLSKEHKSDLNKVEEKRRIWISAISSGLAFGMLHFINLFRQGLLPTINQVIAAAAIGMLFGVCALFVNCRSAQAHVCLTSKLAGDQLTVKELWGIKRETQSLH